MFRNTARVGFAGSDLKLFDEDPFSGLFNLQKAAKWTFEEGKKANDDALKWMEAKGLQVIWNPDRKSFMKAAEKAYDAFRKEDRYDLEIVDKIRALK